jgi:K+-sensing histidine kinase KdpD
MNERDRRDIATTAGGIAPILVAGALVGVRHQVQTSTVALLLVVVVVTTATVGGRLPALVSAVTAALSLNFFHTQPYLRLTIDSAEDAETTVLLLIVGLITGHVAARGHAARRFGRAEIQRIHRVADMTARGEHAGDIVELAERELQDLLDLRQCRFEPAPSRREIPRIERTGAINARHHRFTLSGGLVLPPGGIGLPVWGRGIIQGQFILVPNPDMGASVEQRLMAVAIADQVGAALAVTPPSGRRALPPAG